MQMKKHYFLVIVLLFFVLAACSAENGSGDGYVKHVNYSSLHVIQTFSNGFGLEFMLRNDTGHQLYYDDNFRVDSARMSEKNNPSGLQIINHGDTKSAHVSWEGQLDTGLYTFERDFFLDAGLTEFYTTLTLEFDVIAWHFFAEDAPPIPPHLQARHDARAQEHIDFILAGGASEVIVLDGDVNVSRTEISFRMANLSEHEFLYGLGYSLLIYDDGWKNAPTILDSWGIPGIGLTINAGGFVNDNLDFEWLYGILENGNYMVIRSHDLFLRAGAPTVQEFLIIEFTIDDDTPLNLGSHTLSMSKEEMERVSTIGGTNERIFWPRRHF